MNTRSLITMLKQRIAFRSEFSSEDYWARRYKTGGNSGPGSYGRLAQFKASVLNDFVRSNRIASVVEFGSGDGNQLSLVQYPRYVGYDVSPAAVDSCRRKFEDDATKEFFLASQYDGRQADLALSLDVIFHLTEDRVFEEYLRQLFAASLRFVIIYSSNQDEPIEPVATHVRHRRFSTWVEKYIGREWIFMQHVPNAFPYNGDYESTSFSDFYMYRKG